MTLILAILLQAFSTVSTDSEASIKLRSDGIPISLHAATDCAINSCVTNNYQ